MSHPLMLVADARTVDLTPDAAGPPEPGRPTTASRELGRWAGTSLGVWEHSVGTSHDVEVDEVFVVLTGAATVTFADGTPELTVAPGAVVRLHAGQETTWTVTETLRKVYVVDEGDGA